MTTSCPRSDRCRLGAFLALVFLLPNAIASAAPESRSGAVATAGSLFYPVTPCRLLDTRNSNGPLGGPPLQPGVARSFGLPPTCGIPAGAAAVSVNATVTNTTGLGQLVLFPGDIGAPGTSNLSFGNRQTRAAAVLVPLAADGTIKALATGGAADFILDLNGYFIVSTGPAIVTLDAVPDAAIPTNTTLSLRLAGHSTNAASSLTYALVAGPPNASVSEAGVFSFSPVQTQLGPQSVTVKVQDEGARTAQRAFQVTVVDHDHAPVLGPLTDDTTRVGASYTKVLTATDPDIGDTLTFSLLSGPAGMTLTGSTLSWTPAVTQLGNWPVRVKVTDRAGLDASGLFHVDIPFLTATDDAYSVMLGQTLTVAVPGVLANDVDPLGGSLTAAKTSDPDKGTLNAFNPDGSFTFTAPTILPGPAFQPVLKWNNAAPGWSGDGNPVVADVFGNGRPVVFAARHSSEGGITAIDGATGATLWTVDGSLPAPNAGCFVERANPVDPLAVGDIDDSGVPAIVSAAKCFADGTQGTRMIALNARTGELKWLTAPLGVLVDGQNRYFQMTLDVTPAIARLHPGETPSVLFKQMGVGFLDNASTQRACDQFQVNSGLDRCTGVLALNGADGSVRQRFIAPLDDIGRATNAFNSHAHVMVADLSGRGSGSPNVIAHGAVWDADGNLVSNRLGVGTYSLALAKLDDSGQISIISQEPGLVVARHADGSVQWQAPIYGGNSTDVPGNLSVADLDGDGSPEILTTLEGYLFVYDAKGQIKWIHRYADANDLRTIDEWKRPAAFDLDGDGIAEVIVPTTQGLEFTDGVTGRTKASIAWSDLGVTNTGRPGLADASSASAVVADIDGSGHASIVVTIPTNVAGSSQYVVAIGAQNNDWRPAPTVFNEYAYHFGNVDNVGHIPPVEANNFATPRTNVFGNQPQSLAPVDPRLKSQTSFTYTASDGPLTSAPGTVRIDLLPTNRPPVFTSIAPTEYLPFALSYAAHAVDPDPGDSVSYSILLTSGNGAASCSIDATAGLLSCPSLNAGDQFVVLVATDTQGAAAYQTLTLHQSAGPATVPSVVGQTQAAAGAILTGAGFATGRITTIEDLAPAGQVVQQNPGAGSSVLLGSAVDLVVSKGPAAPPPPPGPPPGLGNIKRIVVSPASALRVVGENVAYSAIAINTDGTGSDVTLFVTWSSTNPAAATVGSTGSAHAVAAGTTLVTATLGGLTGQANLSVAARAPGDSVPPVAAITQPASGGTVTGLTQILGTATDSNFLRYELALEASGDTTFTQFGQGTTQVTNGVLGTLDPTLLLNGAYTLRLTVFDANGNTATADVPFVADGFQKVGNFTLAYTDLTVPLAGIPIQITRLYDSRDKHTGDFGVGWSLGIKALRVSTSVALGTAWQVVQQSTSFALVPGTDHFVSVTLPSGKVETFDLQISPTSSFLTPFSTLFATFVPRPGTLGALQSLENVNLLVADPQPGPVTLLDDTTLATFNPDRFLYTQLEGTQFVVTRTHGVESVKDTSGNQITISPGGISHTSGASIVFARDGNGRITGITDPKAQTQTYVYSTAGDLASHTDNAGNTTGYFYNAAHGIVRIVDPLGRPTARTEYDDDGRLLSLTDAAGHTTTYMHDLPGRQELVEDALGRISVSDYDDRGNVLSTTDPLGNTTIGTYDARDNLLSFTDPLGHTTSTTYDAQNNVNSVTDPLGRTTTFTHDAGGRPLTVTNPRGFTTTSSYDVSGNLVGMTDALGQTASYARDGAGNLTSLTGATGAITRNSYNALGQRTQLTDPLGSVLSFLYDSDGNLLSQQGPAGPASSVSYDPDSRILGTSMGTLHRSITYDAAGQVSSVTTASNQEMGVTMDPLGNLATIADPSGAALAQQTYDAVGNILTVVDALGNQVSRNYDAANRLASIRGADGSMETRTYDAAGRLTQVTDALGHTTAFSYDAAGQLTASTEALGGQTVFQYDEDGNKTAQIDPAGHTTHFAYDALDRLIQTTFADGTTETRAYDAVNRLTQSTDTAGHSASYTYDAAGNLLSVTDPLGHITHHAYQESQRIGTTDAKGNTTSFAYDSSGRLVSTTYPLGDSEATTYDAAGRPLSRTNGKGETVLLQYDSSGRRIATVLPGGATETYTYTADQLLDSVSDSSGTTRLDYDPRTRRLVRVTEPDGRYVRYAFDAVGNKTLVAHGLGLNELVTQYAYDALSRLIQTTDPTGGVTTQTYDAAGNVTSVARPNGVTTTTTFDVRNRPVTIVSRDSGSTLLQQHSYTLDALGNWTRVDAFDGAHVDYQYDALGRVTRERRFDATAVLQLDLVYGYDAAGNLVTAGPAASPSTFAYNADNQLVSGGGVTYAYDPAGRRVQESFSLGGPTLFRNYSWDARDHLTSFQDPSGATTVYTYDSDGVRQSKGGAPGPVTFLVDRDSETGFSQILRETSLSGTNTFVWGTGLLETVEAGTPRFHLFDALGSTRLLTGSSGAVTDSYDYKAYGELLSHVGSSGVRHQFAGEEIDLESGLTYLRARYYDPRTGGFLSRDTLPGDPSDPLSLHPYSYADGNPVNRTDPSGHETLVELMIASYEQVKLQGQKVLQARRGLQKTKEVGAETLRVLGGLMAVEAVMEATTDPRRVSYWFGFGQVGQFLKEVALFGGQVGIEEAVGAVGEAVVIAAELALAKTAFDMLGNKKVDICLQGLDCFLSEKVTGAKSLGASKANSFKNCSTKPMSFAWAIPTNPDPTIEICENFFGLNPLPKPANLTAQEAPSMPGVIVHEFTHVSLRTKDDAYQCTLTFKDVTGKLKKGSMSRLFKKAPGFALINADSYRCWVEDTAIGYSPGQYANPFSGVGPKP